MTKQQAELLLNASIVCDNRLYWPVLSPDLSCEVRRVTAESALKVKGFTDWIREQLPNWVDEGVREEVRELVQSRKVL